MYRTDVCPTEVSCLVFKPASKFFNKLGSICVFLMNFGCEYPRNNPSHTNLPNTCVISLHYMNQLSDFICLLRKID